MFSDLPEKSQVTTKSKVVFIGDIRGRDAWIDVVQENKDADKFVFFGNYFDPFTGRQLDTQAVSSNFFSIINFKDEYPDKVEVIERRSNSSMNPIIGVPSSLEDK